MNAIDLMNGDKDAQIQQRYREDPDWTECWQIATLEVRVALGEAGYRWSDNSEHHSFTIPGGRDFEFSIFRTRVHLDNDWTLSVVSGRTLYGVPAAPYEVMALTPKGGLVGNFDEHEGYENDPWGYQTLDEVMTILKKVEAL